jgi:hypothetical protein
MKLLPLFAAAHLLLAPLIGPTGDKAHEAALIAAFGVEIDATGAAFDSTQGLPVKTVAATGVAATIGVRTGDLMQMFNTRSLSTAADLDAAITSCAWDDPITITVKRAAEIVTLTGVMRRPPSPANTAAALKDVKDNIADIRGRLGEKPSLADILLQLRELEEKLPEAVKRFKEQYPNGEFRIHLHIDIVSDKTAENPIDVLPGKPAPEAEK